MAVLLSLWTNAAVAGTWEFNRQTDPMTDDTIDTATIKNERGNTFGIICSHKAGELKNLRAGVYYPLKTLKFDTDKKNVKYRINGDDAISTEAMISDHMAMLFKTDDLLAIMKIKPDDKEGKLGVKFAWQNYDGAVDVFEWDAESNINVGVFYLRCAT